MQRFHATLLACAALVALAGCGALPNTAAAPTPGMNPDATLPASTPTVNSGAATAAATPNATAPATAAPNASAAPVPTASAPVPTATVPSTALGGVKIDPVVDGLKAPVFATHADDNSGRIFVVEKQGRIVIVRDGAVDAAPFLDITDRVGSSGSEQGLLSVAFHPDYAINGRLFVDYTDKDGNTVIARFEANDDQADAGSELVLLQIEQPYANHNGGQLGFGPDGFMYIGMGDGGSGGDPQKNGQNRDALLGKILRIDVDTGEPYGIPASNPFATSADAKPEVWAYGVRNPWRFSFDRATGDLYIADVGQNQYEEIDMQPANSAGGINYGWNIAEGNHCYEASTCDTASFTAPIDEYEHGDLGCSVTGGYVYRGAAFPQMAGAYLFGDYCSGRIWALQNLNGAWQRTEVLDTDLQISSFGEDQAGEVYLTSLGDGTLYHVVAE